MKSPSNINKFNASKSIIKEFNKSDGFVTKINDINSASSICDETEKYLIKSLANKLIMTNQMKEISDKRNLEDAKEYLSEFGINKALRREELEKKYEMKNLLKFYEKKLIEKKKRKKEDKSQKKENLEKFNKLIVKSKSKKENRIRENVLVISRVENFSIINKKSTETKIKLNFEKLNNLKRLNFDNVKNMNIFNKEENAKESK